MKRLSIFVVALPLVLALSGAQEISKSVSVAPKDGPLQGQTVYTDSWALFVGIGTYQNPKIPHIPPAPNDAKTMRDLLVSRYGFNPAHVQMLTDADATKDGIERALAHLSDTTLVKPTDRVFVFFSGHGQGLSLQDQESVGYLIPYDATIDLGDLSNPSGFQTSCLDMEDVVKRLKACPAKHRAVVIDACFSGFAVGTKGLGGTTFGPDALKRMLDLSGLFVMTAGTSKDEAAADGSADGLSLFTRALVDSLNEGTINGGTFTVEQLAAEAAAKTISRSDGKQSPQFGQKSGSGQMVLFSAAPAPTARAGAVKVLPTQAVLSLSVTPGDATIEVDGKPGSAQTTVETDPGAKKTVTVKVSKDGYKSAGYQVELTAGETTPLSVTLEALALVETSAVTPTSGGSALLVPPFLPAAGGSTSALSPVSYLGRNDVQRELALTDQQRAKLTEANKARQDAQTSVLASVRDGDTDRADAMEKVKAVTQRYLDTARGVLTPAQYDRALQLFVQLEGVRSIANDDVRARLALTDAQKLAISDLLNKFDSDSVALRGSERDRNERKKVLVKNEEVQSAAFEELLTSDQKRKLNELAGRKFDFDSSDKREGISFITGS